GAEVTLDGKPLVHCKGEIQKLLLPGEHQLVASKPGLETETAKLVLLPGKELVHAVQLHPVKAKLARRWEATKPWLVVGAGAGVTLIGALVEWKAHSDTTSFDADATKHCPCPPGVLTDPSLKSTGRIENVLGVTLLVAGGAGLAAGLIGVYLNR